MVKMMIRLNAVGRVPGKPKCHKDSTPEFLGSLFTIVKTEVDSNKMALLS